MALSHWDNATNRNEEENQNPTSTNTYPRIPPQAPIPHPNLRIVTSRAEMDQLPPLPTASTASFHVDSAYKSDGFGSGFGTSSGMRHLGTGISTVHPTIFSSNDIAFEANGSPIILRSSNTPRKESSDDSSLVSFFFKVKYLPAKIVVSVKLILLFYF